jgi:hypothetical protein
MRVIVALLFVCVVAWEAYLFKSGDGTAYHIESQPPIYTYYDTVATGTTKTPQLHLTEEEIEFHVAMEEWMRRVDVVTAEKNEISHRVEEIKCIVKFIECAIELVNDPTTKFYQARHVLDHLESFLPDPLIFTKETGDLFKAFIFDGPPTLTKRSPEPRIWGAQYRGGARMSAEAKAWFDDQLSLNSTKPSRRLLTSDNL